MRAFLLGILILSIGVATGLPGRAHAQADGRIAFVNSELILEGYTGTRDAEIAYKADVDGWNREAEARKRELARLESELEQQGPMLSDEKQREKEQDYQRKLGEYDKFIQSIWGPNGPVVQRNEEILRPIIRRIQSILTRIGNDEGYQLILDAADGNILYADPSLDLTQQVLDELNADPSNQIETDN